ncbi:histone-lysine N-methyltransferase SETMAR [Nephila pilipes]|uniref:Histone-lysine N-methyltransferase SETMAR n=1 Tax=Nephila pilipes TaxID=299642 RepID=A0A8X6IEY0_NEPPI|nr:histone-lysine N-methyltransferase SETMAR [Nephila pilipes]
MIAESLNMSVGSVFTIMTEDLKKKKLCARFVPHTLTTEQKEHRIASSEDLIATAEEDPNILKTIVTGDESWCLEYDPETKRQSSEWTSPRKGRPMKVRASKSKTKTMLLVFFDSRGIIHHEFLRQGSTVIAKQLEARDKQVAKSSAVFMASDGLPVKRGTPSNASKTFLFKNFFGLNDDP